MTGSSFTGAAFVVEFAGLQLVLQRPDLRFSLTDIRMILRVPRLKRRQLFLQGRKLLLHVTGSLRPSPSFFWYSAEIMRIPG